MLPHCVHIVDYVWTMWWNRFVYSWMSEHAFKLEKGYFHCHRLILKSNKVNNGSKLSFKCEFNCYFLHPSFLSPHTPHTFWTFNMFLVERKLRNKYFLYCINTKNHNRMVIFLYIPLEKSGEAPPPPFRGPCNTLCSLNHKHTISKLCAEWLNDGW